LIITHITCNYCGNDYSGLEALEHLDKEIELLTWRIEYSDAGVARQGYLNVLTVLLGKRQILENNIHKENK
jgi:hypothetical protein